MSQDGGRQNQDRNSPGSNLLLWAVAIVAAGLLVILWVPNYWTRELDPSDLKRLVEASPHEEKGGKLKEGHEGSIDVREKGKLFRYSNLHKVVINERAISGLVDVAEVAPQGASKELEPIEKASRDVPFR